MLLAAPAWLPPAPEVLSSITPWELQLSPFLERHRTFELLDLHKWSSVNWSGWGTRGAGWADFGGVRLQREDADMGLAGWFDPLWCSGMELCAHASCKARQKSTATYHLVWIATCQCCQFVFQVFNVQNKVFKKVLPLLTGTNSDERSRSTNFLDQQQKPKALRVVLSTNTALAFQGPWLSAGFLESKSQAFLLFPILCTDLFDQIDLTFILLKSKQCTIQNTDANYRQNKYFIGLIYTFFKEISPCVSS